MRALNAPERTEPAKTSILAIIAIPFDPPSARLGACRPTDAREERCAARNRGVRPCNFLSRRNGGARPIGDLHDGTARRYPVQQVLDIGNTLGNGKIEQRDGRDDRIENGVFLVAKCLVDIEGITLDDVDPGYSFRR